MPTGDELFADVGSTDPVERLLRADPAVAGMIRTNESALRAMLIHSLQRGFDSAGILPARQNRRTPLIEAALAPARDEFAPARSTGSPRRSLWSSAPSRCSPSRTCCRSATTKPTRSATG